MVSSKQEAQATVPTEWNRTTHAVPVSHRELVLTESGRNQSWTRLWGGEHAAQPNEPHQSQGPSSFQEHQALQGRHHHGHPEAGASSESWMIEPTQGPWFLSGTAWFERREGIEKAKPQLYIPKDTDALGYSASDRPKGRIESRPIGEPIPVPTLDPMGMAFPWRWAEAQIC